MSGSRWAGIWPGYLRIAVHGPRLVKFLNLTNRHGIYFWDLEHESDKLFLKIHPRDFKKLRPILRKTGSTVRIVEKKGAFFLFLQGWRRKGLLAGIALFVIVLYFSSLFIWEVRIEGNNEVSKKEIHAFLEKYNIKRGTMQWQVDLQELERRLLVELDDLVWASIAIQGTSLEIQVVERQREPEIPEVVDLVASKDGVVVDVLVLAGEAVIQPGDTVKQGDLLISGTISPPEPEEEVENELEQPGQVIQVQARGVVEAMVWYEEYVYQPLYIQKRRKTGRQTSQIIIKTDKHEIPFTRSREIPFQSYELKTTKRKLSWRNKGFPVELITRNYKEFELETRLLSPWEALNKARSTALEQINTALPRGVSVKKRNLDDFFFLEIGKVGCRITVETREDIAVPEVPLN